MKLPTEEGCPLGGKSPHCSRRTGVQHFRPPRRAPTEFGEIEMMRSISEVAVCCFAASTRRSRAWAISRLHALSCCSRSARVLASSTDARLRSDQMKLATSRSALRPFARQRHLHRGLAPSWSSQSGTGPAGRIARSREHAWARNGAMLDAGELIGGVAVSRSLPSCAAPRLSSGACSSGTSRHPSAQCLL